MERYAIFENCKGRSAILYCVLSNKISARKRYFTEFIVQIRYVSFKVCCLSGCTKLMSGVFRSVLFVRFSEWFLSSVGLFMFSEIFYCCVFFSEESRVSQYRNEVVIPKPKFPLTNLQLPSLSLILQY